MVGAKDQFELTDDKLDCVTAQRVILSRGFLLYLSQQLVQAQDCNTGVWRQQANLRG